MKIWLPYIAAGGGADVFTEHFGAGLTQAGHEVVITAFPRRYLAFPYLLRFAQLPKDTDIIAVHSWWAFAFRREGVPLVMIEHGLVLDPDYQPYRTFAQALRHRLLLRQFISAGLAAADAVVSVSQYTATSLQKVFGYNDSIVILNGIDTNFFSPESVVDTKQTNDRRFKVLFVGHLIRRKGADLLPHIMRELGKNYELRYTSGWRQNLELERLPNMTPLGLLNQEQLREEYRSANILLFPTRFDGFGLPVVEAMACSTPVVASRCCATPELVEDGISGTLCPLDDIKCFTSAIRTIANDPIKAASMGTKAREYALKYFQDVAMIEKYVRLFEKLCKKKIQ